MKIALCIEYDGSNYSGWQKQNDVDSIQGEIEKALGILGLLVRGGWGTCGRARVGVHACDARRCPAAVDEELLSGGASEWTLQIQLCQECGQPDQGIDRDPCDQ